MGRLRVLSSCTVSRAALLKDVLVRRCSELLATAADEEAERTETEQRYGAGLGNDILLAVDDGGVEVASTTA